MNLEPDAYKRPAFLFAGKPDVTDLILPTLKTSHALTGPAPKVDAHAHTRAVRGDLAHVRYAGQVFVSHYAVPMPRTVGAAGASLHTAGREDAEVIGTLAAGETFNLLDKAGGWGWGQQGEDGLVGYLPLTALEP
ncbi:SH3 domain-containing protein [Novosphingobium sp.]|uniref:SH3 domain-containing protein n=1 Tax=Novosphingobium sp. TaxID=1874826 RepID=UPI0025FE3B2B|nr:SH3 domain-containing protein [Novosphingobium sp.]